VTITLSGAAKLVGGAVSFTGSDQMSPFRDSESAGSWGSGWDNPNVDLASVASERVVSTVAADGTAGLSLSPFSGQTQAYKAYTGLVGGEAAGGMSSAVGSSGLTMGWSKLANARWAIAAAAIKPAPTVSLTQYQAQFYAKRGVSRSVQINYSAGGGT